MIFQTYRSSAYITIYCCQFNTYIKHQITIFVSIDVVNIVTTDFFEYHFGKFSFFLIVKSNRMQYFTFPFFFVVDISPFSFGDIQCKFFHAVKSRKQSIERKANIFRIRQNSINFVTKEGPIIIFINAL